MGSLYLVTTPIGNSSDITLNAFEALKKISTIYCEDTRVFRKLASQLEIDLSQKKINSFHDHSSDAKLQKIIDLTQSEDIAFVSDAGSPLISDPAFPLVRKAIENNVDIKSCSGISSVVLALELSGLAPIPFHFHGFLARDNSKKNKEYEDIFTQYGTHIFFEGVSRVLKTLGHLSERGADYDFVVARELTKEYESIYRFKGSEFNSIKNDIVEKGEFVVLIYNPNKTNANANEDIKQMAFDLLEKGARPKSLAKLLSAITGENSKDIYQKLNSSK